MSYSLSKIATDIAIAKDIANQDNSQDALKGISYEESEMEHNSIRWNGCSKNIDWGCNRYEIIGHPAYLSFSTKMLKILENLEGLQKYPPISEDKIDKMRALLASQKDKINLLYIDNKRKAGIQYAAQLIDQGARSRASFFSKLGPNLCKTIASYNGDSTLPNDENEAFKIAFNNLNRPNMTVALYAKRLELVQEIENYLALYKDKVKSSKKDDLIPIKDEFDDLCDDVLAPKIKIADKANIHLLKMFNSMKNEINSDYIYREKYFKDHEWQEFVYGDLPPFFEINLPYIFEYHKSPHAPISNEPYSFQNHESPTFK